MLSKFIHNFKISKKIDNFIKKVDHFINSLKNFFLNKLNNLFKIKSIKLNFISKKKKLRIFTINHRTSYLLFGVIFFILSYLSVPFFYNNYKLIDKIERRIVKKFKYRF